MQGPIQTLKGNIEDSDLDIINCCKKRGIPGDFLGFPRPNTVFNATSLRLLQPQRSVYRNLAAVLFPQLSEIVLALLIVCIVLITIQLLR